MVDTRLVDDFQPDGNEYAITQMVVSFYVRRFEVVLVESTGVLE